MKFTKEQFNPLLINEVDLMKLKRDVIEEPKYNVGEIVDLETWGGLRKNFKVEDVKITYHPRLDRYCWGYKMSGEQNTGFNFTYIPEGYLRRQEEK